MIYNQLGASRLVGYDHFLYIQQARVIDNLKKKVKKRNAALEKTEGKESFF